MTDNKEEQDQLEANATSETNQRGNSARIFLSILVLALAGTTAAFAYLRDGDFVQDLLVKDEWISQLIGNLHPILMLLPLGLILLVLLVEVLAWLSFKKCKHVAGLTLFWVVITTVLASVSGLVLMKLEGNSGPDWAQYLWYGVGAMAAFALSYICKIWGRNRNGSGIVYALFLLGGIGALGYGGYIYGPKVHTYAVVPSASELTTPFGNQKVREQMSASIAELEESKIMMQAGLSKKEEAIALSNSARETAENKFRGEQEKVAMAQKDVVKLNEGMKASQQKAAQAQLLITELKTQLTDAQKQTAEGQKKVQAGNAEKLKFQEEIKALQSQIEALKKQSQDAAKKQEDEAKAEKPKVEKAA
jgi:uncharacterized membrane protein